MEENTIIFEQRINMIKFYLGESRGHEVSQTYYTIETIGQLRWLEAALLHESGFPIRRLLEDHFKLRAIDVSERIRAGSFSFADVTAVIEMATNPGGLLYVELEKHVPVARAGNIFSKFLQRLNRLITTKSEEYTDPEREK